MWLATEWLWAAVLWWVLGEWGEARVGAWEGEAMTEGREAAATGVAGREAGGG